MINTSDFLRDLQRVLYFAQRTTGDIRAAQRGPDALGKRLVRRSLTRAFFRLFR